MDLRRGKQWWLWCHLQCTLCRVTTFLDIFLHVVNVDFVDSYRLYYIFKNLWIRSGLIKILIFDHTAELAVIRDRSEFMWKLILNSWKLRLASQDTDIGYRGTHACIRYVTDWLVWPPAALFIERNGHLLCFIDSYVSIWWTYSTLAIGLYNRGRTQTHSFIHFLIKRPSVIDSGVACLLAAGPKSVARTMDAANCAAVLLSVPISYHFHGCTALLVRSSS